MGARFQQFSALQKRQKCFLAKINPQDLNVLSEMLATDRVRPVIDRCYPLCETAEALRYLGQGHAHGKVIITMNHA